MQILFTNDSVTNTRLTIDDVPAYEVTTPRRLLHHKTTITRLPEGSHPAALATIRLHSSSPDMVLVFGRDVTPKKTYPFSKSRAFWASNNKKYKWKPVNPLKSNLRDEHKVIVATFERKPWTSSNAPRPVILTIVDPNLEHLRDEIVATCIYIELRRRHPDVKGYGSSEELNPGRN